MDHVSPTAGARVLVVALTALLLGACGSSSTTTTPPAGSTPSATAPTATGAGTKVDVTEKEYAITLSQTTFAPGNYTFAIKNTGSIPHNLAIEGPGVDKQVSPTVTGGKSTTLTVALQAGTYELSCAVPGHKDQGMDLKIKVS